MNVWGYTIEPIVALILVPLIAFGFYGVLALFAKRKATDEKKVNWTPLEAVGITIAVYVISQLVGGTLLGIVLGAMGKSSAEVDDILSHSNIAQFFFVLLVEAITIGAFVWFARRRQTALRLMGVVRPKWRDIGYAALGVVAYFGIYIIAITLVTALAPGLNVDQKQDLGFDSNTAGGALALVFISLVILPPLAEELMCRGFLFSGLRTRLSLVPAMVITSGLFAAAHLQAGSGNDLLWVAALDTFTLSLVLVYLREKTGSLWPGIWLHMAKNLIAFLVLFVFHSA